jgi:hypothetical protein
VYVERLSVRARWWAVVIGIALVGSLELAAGFNAWVVAGVVAASLVPTVTLLALAGRTVVRVDGTGITAGTVRVDFDDIESVEALDARRTRLVLGPEADPAAKLVVRGFVKESVVVRPLRSTPIPYWLISTRQPHQVVAAVEQAARATRVP